MIRSATVQINYRILRQCREAAKSLGVDCSESLIELWLTERLAQMPEIAELTDALADAEKQVRKAWAEKYQP
jgi:hypothetical protein